MTQAVARISCPSASKSRGRPLGSTAVAIRNAVIDLTDKYAQMTVRQCFYAIEVAGIVEKSEAGYRQVQAQVLRMRREGLLSWDFITDGTRWQRKPESFDSVEDAMATMARTYRRDLWRSQNKRIEIWLEKDALADLVVDATSKWDMSLMVSRGQSSATFLWNAAKQAEGAWQQAGIETHIYALYDRDAGGRRAARTIERDLPQHAPGVPINFTLLGVTDAQVEDWQLPTRPAKQSDPEAAKFDGRAVELDAIPPDKLIGLVENAIIEHVDARSWAIEQSIEHEEREVLYELTRQAA